MKFYRTVGKKAQDRQIQFFQCPTIPDQIIRGNLQIVKFREDKEEESEQGEQKVPLEGNCFLQSHQKQQAGSVKL